MTVAELINQLQEIKDKTKEVVLSDCDNNYYEISVEEETNIVKLLSC